MDQRRAFKETLDLAIERDMPDYPGTSFGLEHLKDMWSRLDKNFSDAKVGRWLGWAQACVVIDGLATLEEMKQINLKYADDSA